MGLRDFESGMALWVHKPASGSLLFSTPLFSHVSNDDAGPPSWSPGSHAQPWREQAGGCHGPSSHGEQPAPTRPWARPQWHGCVAV